MTSERIQVAIVGAGPVGLTLANFLGQAGVRTVVLEQKAATTDEPRAVNLDDESLRTMQGLGLGAEVADTLLPATGTKYISKSGKTVAYAHPRVRPQGHWPKNVFVQPDFDALLAREAAKLDLVDVRFETALTELEQDDSGVRLKLDHNGAKSLLEADWVVGSDGGRSTVREALGIKMSGSTFEQPWIVLDTIDDPNRSRFSRHHLDPDRPFVVVPGREGRCRYEFMLLPGETANEMLQWDQIEKLLRPHREITAGQVIRQVIYTFHALSAERWRDRRVVIGGDAAHMMPPMAGQGLNSGVRDAHNLGWKLALVANGLASPKILDTYEQERKTHAESMIKLSTRMGNILMTTNPHKAKLIRAAFAATKLLPPANRYLTDMRFKPKPAYREGFMQEFHKGSWIGRLVPQPLVMIPDGAMIPFDNVLGSGFGLMSIGAGPDSFDGFTQPVWDRIVPHRVEVALGDVNPLAHPDHVSVADVDDRLAEAFAAHHGEVLLIRPDRYVAASCHPERADDMAAWLERALDGSLFD